MHDLPIAVFAPQDARDPQGDGARFGATTDLGAEALDLDDVSQVRGRVLDDVLDPCHHALTPPHRAGARSIRSSTISQPRATGKKGLATVTSSPWEKSAL